MICFDVECYPNYFLVGIQNFKSRVFRGLEIFSSGSLCRADIKILRRLVLHCESYAFNSIGYDNIMCNAAMMGWSVDELFQLNEKIINSKNSYDIIYELGFRELWDFRVVDLMPIAGKGSLKTFGARLHTSTLQELPYEAGSILTRKQANNVLAYCKNDLNVTHEIANAVKGEIDIRRIITRKYGVKAMSLSNAQIAEKILRKKIRTNKAGEKVDSVQYELPHIAKHLTGNIRDLAYKYANTTFDISKKGTILQPKWLKSATMTINNVKYNLGIGGLHGSIKSKVIKESETSYVMDCDVESYYPSLVCSYAGGNELVSRFVTEYRKLLQDRLVAKANGDTASNNVLKIVINGATGKINSMYSALYSPDIYLYITITGQLLLLHLVSLFNDADIKVIMANTDSVMALPTAQQKVKYKNIIDKWQDQTGYRLDVARINKVAIRDVNNYIAVLGNGKVKVRGAFANVPLASNRKGSVITNAVVEHFTKNTPIRKTLANAPLGDYIFMRKVTGGAIYKNKDVGFVCRWIWVKDGDTILYKKNNNRVPKADGAQPIITMGDKKNYNVDYKRYELETLKTYETLGFNYAGE